MSSVDKNIAPERSSSTFFEGSRAPLVRMWLSILLVLFSAFNLRSLLTRCLAAISMRFSVNQDETRAGV